jgi:hypothetical protein
MSDENTKNYDNTDLSTPDGATQIIGDVATWGGRDDYVSGQDSGETASGVKTYDPKTDTEPTTSGIAIDPAWLKKHGGVVNYGDLVDVINPETGASKRIPIIDAGPNRRLGRLADIRPQDAKDIGLSGVGRAIIDFKPAIQGYSAGSTDNQDQQDPNAPQTGLEDLTTPEGAQSYLARATANPASQTAATGSLSGSRTDITGTKEDLGVTKLPDGGYDIGNGYVGYPNGIIQLRTGNSTTEFIPDPTADSGYKTHTFQVTPKKADSLDDVAAKEAAKKGILRSNYPEGEEGDQQYKDELKLTLGAGVADDIAEAIVSGKQPPDTKGLYRTGPQVRAKLAKLGYDLKDANLDWQASQRFILSQNSPPLVRLRQSAMTADHSLDVIDDLSKQWQAGRFPALNKARLAAAQQGAFGQQAASLARQLDGQINDLTFELGNVYMGGGTPTDQALVLAKKNLSADWDDKTLRDMTNLARRNLQIRLNSFKQVEPAGLSEEAAKEDRWTKTHADVAPTPAVAPSTAPQVSKSPSSYSVGQSVKLNGKMVTIDSIDPTTGSFTYH